jgi:hypothetical protein
VDLLDDRYDADYPEQIRANFRTYLLIGNYDRALQRIQDPQPAIWSGFNARPLFL